MAERLPTIHSYFRLAHRDRRRYAECSANNPSRATVTKMSRSRALNPRPRLSGKRTKHSWSRGSHKGAAAIVHTPSVRRASYGILSAAFALLSGGGIAQAHHGAVPLYRVTVDNVRDLRALKESLVRLPVKPTARAYLDVHEPPGYYAKPLQVLRQGRMAHGRTPRLLRREGNPSGGASATRPEVRAPLPGRRRSLGDRQLGERKLDRPIP